MKRRYIIALVILFMAIGIDYQRYFYGKSIINYRVLPYGISPLYIKDFEKDKERKSNHFFFVYNKSEFFGSCAVPTNTYHPKFIVTDILEYYYSKNKLLIKCKDEDGLIRWVIPTYDKSGIYFHEIKKIYIGVVSRPVNILSSIVEFAK